MKKGFLKLFVVVIVFSLFGCKDSNVNVPQNNQPNEITIGALVSLTGNWSTLGITSKAALEIAVKKINQNFIDEGINIKINLKVIDTKLDPEIAYVKTGELIFQGVKIIIGPQSSSELSRIRPLVNQNDVIVVSMGSTDASLAIPNDHILRFCPDDKPEGKGVSKLMWERGIREVVAVYLNDNGNIGLKRSMTQNFINSGGSVIDSLTYSSDSDITANFISQLSTIVNNASNPNDVGIYLAGFDEVTKVFTMSSSDVVLSSKKWFGSNGSAGSSILISNNAAAKFGNSVEFCSPLFSLSFETESDWSPLVTLIEQETQLKPDAYAFAAYDALMVAALTFKSVGASTGLPTLFNKFVEISSTYRGLTGLTELNEAGDRKFGNFTFLGICGVDPNFAWKDVGFYNAATDIISDTGCL